MLGLSVGASAVYSLVAIVARLTDETPLADQSATLNPSQSDREWLDFSYQFLGIFFDLVRRRARAVTCSGSPGEAASRRIGLDFAGRGRDSARHPARSSPSASRASPLYAAGRALGLTVAVVRVAARHLLVDRARPAALGRCARRCIEEVIVVGYLFTRLRELGWGLAIILSRRCSAAATTSTRASGRSSATSRWASCSAGATGGGAA